MAKVITTELQHSGASGANITLDSSKNVTCENNLTVDGTTTLTGTVSLPDDTVTIADLAATGTASSSTFLRGDNSWAAVSGNPITVADCWRVNAHFGSNTSETTISANWERADDSMGEGGITSSQMSESSGVFTFPSTGIYRIEFFATASTNDWSVNPHEEITLILEFSTNTGSSYDQIAKSTTFITDVPNPGRFYSTLFGSNIVDVTNTTTHKVRLQQKTSYTGIRFEGNSGGNFGPTLTFIRLGDT